MESLWNGNVFIRLLPPFRSCIKLLKLNTCQFTSKQLGSHWCCLFSRGVIINSMSLNSLHLQTILHFLFGILLGISWDYLLWKYFDWRIRSSWSTISINMRGSLGEENIWDFEDADRMMELSNIPSFAENTKCSNLARFWTKGKQ